MLLAFVMWMQVGLLRFVPRAAWPFVTHPSAQLIPSKLLRSTLHPIRVTGTPRGLNRNTPTLALIHAPHSTRLR